MVRTEKDNLGSAKKEDFTIVTVCIAKHFQYIPHQIELIDKLNSGADWKMLVVDNTTTSVPILEIGDRRCQVMSGVPLDADKPDECRGSYHHAAALNKAIKEVRTRFLLVLDPDLFVVYRNWIRECMQHMIRNGLGFFGVPWHPRWYSKYRNFPCVHFLMIDLNKVDRDRIDFMPSIIEQPNLVNQLRSIMKKPGKLEMHPKGDTQADIIAGKDITIRMAYFLFRRYKRYHLVKQLFSRLHIQSSYDTGWKLWCNFGRGKHLSDVVLPVVDFKAELAKPKHLLTKWGRFIERRLPRRWSFLPAVGTYVETKHAPGFCEHPHFGELKSESFIWRGAPFAFHLRRNVRDIVEGGGDAEKEQRALDHLLINIKTSPCWILWGMNRQTIARER